MSSLPLGEGAGTVGYAVWTPARPGDLILVRLAVPLLLLFGVFMLVSRYVVRLTGRLEYAADAAQAADLSKTEFLANISHELRTPMNGIIGTDQLIQKMELDPKAAKLMEVLMTSARSQMVLIEYLLDLSRIDSGNRRRDHLPFDPVAALNEVRDMMVLRAEAKGIDFKVETPAGLDIHVLGDKAGYNQILINLISNAIKFTDTGHVTVRMQATPAPDRGSLDQVRLLIEVTDTGPGVDPKNHEMIFERFGQAGESSTGEISGVGLCLAITKSLVEMMGGKLGLTSDLGKGAKFSFDLPFDIATKLEPRAPAG
jgi:signal transduction histidine kinase